MSSTYQEANGNSHWIYSDALGHLVSPMTTTMNSAQTGIHWHEIQAKQYLACFGTIAFRHLFASPGFSSNINASAYASFSLLSTLSTMPSFVFASIYRT